MTLPHDAGIATVALPMLLWTATLVAIVTIDAAAYLVAASRAQALADAAALAAVVPDIPGATALTPRAEAERVVHAGGGELDACTCRRGHEHARVSVSVEVPGLMLPALGAGRVMAESAAVLAPGEPPPWPLGAASRWFGGRGVE